VCGTPGGQRQGRRGSRTPEVLNRQLAGQIGWLIPLAVGLAERELAELAGLSQLPTDRQQQARAGGDVAMLVVVFFSVAETGDPTIWLCPAWPSPRWWGVGVVALWHDYRARGGAGGFYPDTCGYSQPADILALPDWSRWLAPTIFVPVQPSPSRTPEAPSD